MKIVCISPWYSERMGYSENMLPKALSKAGAEVHLIASTAQVYYNAANYAKVYEPFIGPKIVESETKIVDGYTLHRLPYVKSRKKNGLPGITNLYQKLKELNPDIIQTFDIDLDSTYEAAKYCQKHTRLLFTECHMHASVFWKGDKKTIRERLRIIKNSFNTKLRFVNSVTKICYAIAPDVEEIAALVYKVPEHKIRLQSLGVDTDLFHPPLAVAEQKLRHNLRLKFGFTPSDVVCIYTGRFTRDKDPHCLARAISILNGKSLPFKGLFVGNGAENDINFIKSNQGCTISPFVPVNELPQYYWAADIGVWPREESTSQIDALACGLPLILSNKIKVMDRVEGNGLLFMEGDPKDLSNKIIELQNAEKRKQMAEYGLKKLYSSYSWEILAKKRMEDYSAFLKG